MLQCCHESLHFSVVNTNFATSVWKQEQIAYRPAGLADKVLNDCESWVDVISSGLLDILAVAWSVADNYVFGAFDHIYLYQKEIVPVTGMGRL